MGERDSNMNITPKRERTWPERRGGFMSRITLILILGLLAMIAVAGVAWRWRLTVPDSARDVLREVTDATITGQVKTAFALSKRLSAYDIAVETKEGVVTLTGQTPSEIDKELAGDVARDTTGVKQVDNQLRVEPGLKPSDASLRESSRIM